MLDLLSNLTNPPTIKELASKIGMNERRLRTGFSELFDTSIYNTVLTNRMALAIEKLEQGNYCSSN
jgi:AraC-like DNA-binding protein